MAAPVASPGHYSTKKFRIEAAFAVSSALADLAAVAANVPEAVGDEASGPASASASAGGSSSSSSSSSSPPPASSPSSKNDISGEAFGLQVIPGGAAVDNAHFVNKVLEPRHAVAILEVAENSKRHKLVEEIANDKAIGHIVTFGVRFVGKGSSLKVYRHRYPTETFEGKWTKSAIRAWLMEVGYPLVNRMTNQFPPAKYLSVSSFGVVLIVKPLNEQSDALVEALEPFAKKYQDKLKFSFFTKSGMTVELCDGLGVWGNDELLLLEHGADVGLRSHTHKPGTYKYRLEGVTKESVVKFFDDYENKRLPRYLQSRVSRPAAEKLLAESKNVLELTSWNFLEVVQDPKRAVLVVFTSANCDACEEFQTPYEEVARRVKDSARKAPDSLWSSIVVARLDQSRNEHTETIRGTPWMKFWPRGIKKRSVDVELRSVDMIFEYLENHVMSDDKDEL